MEIKENKICVVPKFNKVIYDAKCYVNVKDRGQVVNRKTTKQRI